MIRLGRDSRGLTQAELAKRSGLAQGLISKVENDLVTLDGDRLAAVADALGYPVQFLAAEENMQGVPALFHRRLRSTPALELKRAQAQVNLLRIQVHRLLAGVTVDAPFAFPRLDLDDIDGDVEEAAAIVRRAWRLPHGPVQNVTRAIEEAGGIVVVRHFGTAKIDAASQWLPAERPVFVVRPDVPGERQRLNLAHEIGHMVLHTDPGADDVEKQAFRFAGALLVPAAEFRTQVRKRLTLEVLFRLKQYWKVSMQGLTMRAYDLGLISDRQRQRLFQTFGARGYRKQEPGALPPERPHVLGDVLNAHLTDHRYTTEELAQVAMLRPDEFRAQYDVGMPSPSRRLRAVPHA